jgi:hypothetical protein
MGSFISCGEDDEEEDKNGETNGTVEETITVEEIVGTYELVSFYDKDGGPLGEGEEVDLADVKNTRVISADNTYSVEETEAGEVYTESGTFSITSDNLIIFEIKESSDTESVDVKNTYAIDTASLPGRFVLVLQDSTDELFKEDVGDVLTYEEEKD